MALKIKQNGKVKDLIIPACDVQILDMEDNFESSNLEEVLQEICEGESVYISDKEPDKDGIWISSDNTSTAGENPTLVALKEYVNTQLSNQNDSFDEKLKEYYALRQAQVIQENDDLDNYKDYGNYVSRSGAISKTLANCPYAVAGFVLHVERTTGGEETFKMQTLIANSSNCDVYRRVLIDGVWRPWVLEIKDIHISNPNLLINGDFKINQRGKTSYTITGTSTYTVDRWISYNLTTDTTVITQLSNGISIKSTTGTQARLRQWVEDKDTFKLVGKRVTFSIKVISVCSDCSFYIYKNKNTLASTMNFKNIKANDILSYTFDVDSSYTQLGVQFVTSDPKGMSVEYAKLEVGTVKTAFSPRPYSEELSLCQRYYQNDFLGRVQLRSRNDSADTTSLLGFLQYNTPMRIRPTLKLKDGADLTQSLFGASFGYVTPTKFLPYIEGDKTGMHIGFTLDKNVDTANVFFSLRYNILEAEAELY